MLPEGLLVPCTPCDYRDTGVKSPSFRDPYSRYHGIVIDLKLFDLKSEPGQSRKAIICLDDPSDNLRMAIRQLFLAVTALKLMESEIVGLLLQPVENGHDQDNKNKGTFKRVGRFTIPLDHLLGVYLWNLTPNIPISQGDSAWEALRRLPSKSILPSIFAPKSHIDHTAKRISGYNIPCLRQPQLFEKNYLGFTQWTGQHIYKII